MNGLTKKIKQNKSVISFSILKYLEIIITSLTTLVLANNLAPQQMGLSIPIFLYITYANYFSLGVNQVILKNYSRYDNDNIKNEFIGINLQFLILACILNFIVSFVILDIKYSILAALISSGNIMKSYFMSYFRVNNRIIVLNKNNIIYSILMLLGTLFLVNSISSYLILWSFCVVISFILYFTSDYKFYKFIFSKLHVLPSKISVLKHLKEGVKLALSGAIATILLTSDRFLINKLNLTIETKGVYQLADFIGTAYYLVLSTVIFYFFPNIIQKVREDIEFRKKYLKRLFMSLLSFPVILFIVYLLSYLLSPLFFPEFFYLEKFITLNVLLKSCVLLVSLISTYYIALDQESIYLKLISLVLIVILILLLGIYYLNIDLVFVPIAISVSLLFFVIANLIYHARKKVIS